MSLPRHRSRAFVLARRPRGQLEEACFTLTEEALPPLGCDEVLVDNLAMSIDPYMYLRAVGGELAGGSYEIGGTPDAYAIGRVRESRSDRYRAGDLVTSFAGWRDCFVSAASSVEPAPAGFALSPEAHLSVLGVAAFTAWVGMTQFVRPAAGQVIFISGAAGGVGVVACQLAARAGLKVVASAGTDEKCAWLAGLNNVHTINYRQAPDLLAALRAEAPDGIDLYFDNVGGHHLETAIRHAKPRAQFIACGAISSFVESEDPRSGLTDIRMLPTKSITMHAYTVSHFFHLHDDFIDFMRDWLREGGPVVPMTVFEGLEAAPRALRSLFGGGNLGKTIVRIADAA
jgi:NADPH-dependent curcumin reductase CurA